MHEYNSAYFHCMSTLTFSNVLYLIVVFRGEEGKSKTQLGKYAYGRNMYDKLKNV